MQIVSIAFQALAGESLGLLVRFSDGEDAIYLAEFSDMVDEEPVAVPAPLWMLMTLLAALAATGARRLRKS